MALRSQLPPHHIKDSGKLCSILTKRLVPTGPAGRPPPFTPWVLLILSSAVLMGVPLSLHQTGAERACPCPCADFPTFWLRSSKSTCGDFTTALGSSSREGWQRAGGVVSSLPEMARGSLVPWGGGEGASGGPSQHPSHFPSRVCMPRSSIRAGKLLSFLLSFPRPSAE